MGGPRIIFLVSSVQAFFFVFLLLRMTRDLPTFTFPRSSMGYRAGVR